MIYSRHAKHRYRLAPQRRGIGTIDIRHVRSTRELYKHWMEYVGKKGSFSLQSRTRKGTFGKCIAVIRVTNNGITFKDNRCALCVILRNRKKRIVHDTRI